ncbi:MAG TPA: anti-sigma factor [Kofleriaceae bacterium]|nr:anti-sigma factor [Kofleriaceae bacterium]
MLDCSKIDELMMDWLYQELDESSSKRIAEHVEGCPRCSAEASALQRTRAAFRDLSPVEPPSALSAILLHEAARRAPAVAVAAPRAADSGVGFWARLRAWFRPIALHPAAAAVATLVLIAGVAGTLYVRHGDEMTDTRDLVSPPATAADSNAAASTPAEEPAPSLDIPVAPAATATPEPAADDEAPADGFAADVLGADAQAELSRELAEHRLESMAKEGARQFALEKKAPPPAKKKSRKPAEDPKGPIANAVSGADPLIEGEMDLRGAGAPGGATNAQGRTADKIQQSAQPPPAPPSSTSSTRGGAIDFDSKGDGGGYRAYKQKPMSPAELKASEGKLGVAVKKNDCVTAARIANDILDRNSDYYYKRVAGQTKPCQMAVNQERSRRASRNVGSGSKNVAAPQKAKAAPQKDQAAEAAE